MGDTVGEPSDGPGPTRGPVCTRRAAAKGHGAASRDHPNAQGSTDRYRLSIDRPEHDHARTDHASADHRSADAPPTAGRSLHERLVTDVHGLVKPLLRGRIHLAAFVLSIPAGALLVARADTGRATVGALAYALSLTALYGASSAYHRLGRTVRSQRLLRRLDHGTIYVLIAGTYTPICLLVLDGPLRWALLMGVWVAAAAGFVMKLVRFDGSHWLGSLLYGVMGCAAFVALPQLVTRLPVWVWALLGAGGAVYGVGALILARRWPDPRPRVFGYHEIWHTLVVVAGVCHYVVVFHVVGSA